MTNQETQLELDLGILTVAQQERVNSFIKSKKEYKILLKIVMLLKHY
jgi:hypothetical protein